MCRQLAANVQTLSRVPRKGMGGPRAFRWHHPGVKIRITTKLFLAVLATATLTVAGMGFAAHWSLTQGFLGYVNEQAMERLETTLPTLQAAYEEHGSWEFLRERPHGWMKLLVPRPDEEPRRGRFDDGPLLFEREFDGPFGRDGPPEPLGPRGPLPVSELTGAILRWGLRDADHRYVVGYEKAGIDLLERPVVVKGQTVGYVTMAPFQSVAAAGADRFARSQLEATLLVGGLALCLAALIAGWISVALMRPIQRIAKATHRLAAGDYDMRVAARSHDEVGALASDFNHLAEALQKNADVRRSLFADISHELRTPLAVLKGELEAIDDGVRPLTRPAVKSLLGEVDALSQLVADLHKFALAGSGSLSYRMQPMRLDTVLRETLEAFARRFVEHGLRLATHVADGLEVNGDEARLRQVFHNLLENALRYTDAGGEVQVHAWARDGEVVVRLQDSAPGVPEAELPLLFDRFYRAQMPGARTGGGSGLGLAICRAVVEAHRGRIEAAPSPLGGVAVTLRMPGVAP